MEYQILHIEDSKTDADLVQRVIQKAGLNFRYQLASDKEEVSEALNTFKPNIILCDHSLPSFNSKMAYDLCKEENPDLTFILVTGAVSEEFAVEMLKTGVDDYLLKSNLQRLPLAIENAFNRRSNDKKVQAIRDSLQQSETHLRTIFENSSAGLILIDRNFKILELNDRAKEYFLISTGQELVKNTSLVESVPTSRKDILQEKLRKSLSGESLHYESVYPQQDGSVITFDVKLSPTINGDGIVTGSCMTFEDISERKRAEQAIKENETFITSIFSSINYHIAVIDTNGNIIAVNKAWEDFSFQNGESLLDRTCTGSNYVAVCQKAADEGDTIAAKALNGFRNVIEKQNPIFEMEYPCHSPDDERWYMLRIINFADNSPKVLMMHIDITEIKKAADTLLVAEKEFRSLAESMPQIVWVTDAKGQYTYFNQQWVAYTGLSLEESYGDGWNKIVHPEDRIQVLEVWSNALENQKDYALECRLKCHDGSYRWWLIKGVPKKSDNGKIQKWYGTYTDIETIKLAEEKIRYNEKRLKLATTSAAMGIWDWDLKNDNLLWDEGMLKLYDLEHSTFDSVYDTWISRLHCEDKLRVNDEIKNCITAHKEYNTQFRIIVGDSIIRYISATGLVERDDDGNPLRMIGLNWDVTETKEAEKEILKLNWLYLFTAGINEMILRVTDEETLFSEACRIAIDCGKFKMSWIGVIDEDTKKVIPIKHAGQESGYLSMIKSVSVNDSPEGRGPTGTALRQGKYVVCNDIENDPLMAPWKEAALDRGYLSSMSVPVRKFGKVIGGYTFYAEVKDFFDTAEIALLQEASNNVGFALEILEKEALRKKAEQNLEISNKELRNLSSHLQTVREEERIRIAREIHDDLGQQLTGLKMDVSWLGAKLPATNNLIDEKIEEIKELIDNTIITVRRISGNLRPPALDDLGLVAALDWHSHEIETKSGIKVNFTCNVLEVKLPTEHGTGLFRIYQEALTNAVRHSNAKTINASLIITPTLITLTIADNGRGIDKQKNTSKSFGLVGIKERAYLLNGTFDIQSRQGEGTTLTVEVPMNSDT